jgi:hypothetical protein
LVSLRQLQPAVAGLRFAPLYASCLVPSNAPLVPVLSLLNWFKKSRAFHALVLRKLLEVPMERPKNGAVLKTSHPCAMARTSSSGPIHNKILKAELRGTNLD